MQSVVLVYVLVKLKMHIFDSGTNQPITDGLRDLVSNSTDNYSKIRINALSNFSNENILRSHVRPLILRNNISPIGQIIYIIREAIPLFRLKYTLHYMLTFFFLS